MTATSRRPRGFAPWRPQARTRDLLDQVAAVMQTYSDLLPLTARQIFYRLVATTGYDKSEAAYTRLLETLNRARRAGLIPMDYIRDDGAIVVGNNRFSSPDDFLQNCQAWAAEFRLDLMQYQRRYVELLCEAGGMVPQLQRVAEPYGVTVRSSGGFDSTTVKHSLGRFYAKMGKPAVVLHVGDLDPSGEHIHLSLGEDVGAFALHYGGTVEVQRVAVTAEQQARYDLPTAPPKPTDRRSFSAGFTVQAEALPPEVLADLVREAIESNIDLDAHRQAVNDQAALRDDLVRRLQGVA